MNGNFPSLRIHFCFPFQNLISLNACSPLRYLAVSKHLFVTIRPNFEASCWFRSVGLGTKSINPEKSWGRTCFLATLGEECGQTSEIGNGNGKRIIHLKYPRLRHTNYFKQYQIMVGNPSFLNRDQ